MRLILALLIAALPTLARAQSYPSPIFASVTLGGAGGQTITGVGTTAGTVAGGNDSRIVGATQNAAAAIVNGTINGTAIGGTAPAAGAFTNLSASGGITGALTGNASTASALATARTLSLSGDITGSASFDGSANVGIAGTLAASGVTAGSYVLPNLTLDAKGRATSASNGALTGDVTTSAGSLATTIAPNVVTPAKMSQAAAGTLRGNPTGSTANVSDNSLSSYLDVQIGSTRSTIAVRGASIWGALTPSTSGCTFQFNGTDTVCAAASPGTGALRYDASQTLTSSQQDQVRSNVSGPVPSTPSTAVTLVAADIERPLYPTGTGTITAANGGAGWRSGPILNSNTTTGTIALAVPSGATLDGVTNGTTALLPKQKARIVQTGATAYVTDWIDRTPLLISARLTSAAVSADYLLPLGYSAYEITLTAQVDTAGAGVGLRFSSDGGSTFKAGSSDYLWQSVYSSASGVSAGAPSSQSYYPLVSNQDAQSVNWTIARAMLVQGTGTIKPLMQTVTSAGIEGGNFIQRAPAVGNYSTAALVVNALRVLTTTGNMVAGTTFSVRGIPPT
ncbi:hypothetical protein LOK46_10485 [Methylobacterium sp. NMS14P]|uniref:hypothetical protein n=1 Tax=Methylobacterium sp. NMS14P TaxID=2894310 RepID=UPI002359F4A8|nr:hypothetical protein [Methylobacterium sp. NMS14P]WCS27216.1 hypothetical protein LOK46_10485 [Methylobacterium sp. NMS14P]